MSDMMDTGNPVEVADTLVNLISGLGSSKDKGAQGRFTYRAGLTRSEIDSLYGRNWLGGKVVDIPCDDATREWRVWRADKPAVEMLEALEQQLRVRAKVNRALKWAAKDGGSAIILGVDGDPEVELDVSTMKKGSLRWLHLVSRYELSYTEMIYDPASPWVGQPKEYTINRPDGVSIKIHPSRVVPFIGTPRSDLSMRMDPWGESVFERIHDAIRDATSAAQTAASMLQEAKLDVVRIPGLTANIMRPEYRAAVISRFGLAMTTKSVNNALIFDKDEEYQQKTLTFQGLPEIIEKLLQIVAGAADMPVTRLLGRSPAGLNATGRADLEGYYTMVRSRQETHLRPSMERIDEALIRSATGRKPRGIFSEWRTLWSIAETDQAQVDQARSAAVEAYARAGIFTQEALQSAVIAQLVEDSFLPGIEDAVKAFPGVGPAPNQPAQPKPGSSSK